MLCCHRRNDRIPKILSSGKRAVCLNSDSLLFAIFHNLFLLVPWVELNLIDTRSDGDVIALSQHLEMSRSEVADTDTLDFALRQRVLQTQPCLMATVWSGARVVDQVEIDIVKVEEIQGLIDGVVSSLASVFVIPYFRSNVDGGPGKV